MAGTPEAPTAAPAPWGPTPSVRQLRWQGLEYYGFLHFTVNTFTDKEWGFGDESPSVFNPTALDARQWARTARDAGMKGLILTAKHHDGFCLWPSRYTQHSVKYSPWRDGQGDVVKELSVACREFGLKLGLYLSPWDRNHADYGTPAYVEYYKKQLEEILTQYGELFEVWFDGANGGDGYYGGAREKRKIDERTYYNFPVLWDIVRQHQPDAVMFSDVGPDIRWVGNEAGHAPDVCWARVNPEGMYVGAADVKRLGSGEPDGTVWRPAEVDVSTRRGWFYHDAEQAKSAEELLDIYYSSVGLGCCLLLNMTPDRRGLIPEGDVTNLMGLRHILDETFAADVALARPVTASCTRGNDAAFAPSNATDGNSGTYWAADDDVTEAALTVHLGCETPLKAIRIEEYIELGQRVAAFAIDARVGEEWREIAAGGTIGARRIMRLPDVKTDQIRLRIVESLASPTISTIRVY